MQRRILSSIVLPTLAVTALAVSAASAQTTVVVTPTSPTVTPEFIAPVAPPPLQVETIPPAPSTVVAWQAGHWRYTGAGWTWISGQYVEHPQQLAVWEPGRWQPQPNGTYGWVDGHWRN